ncbi:GtrA family protein [Demequina pelophila]|uniref:GtrA family protein n=1 Tax=Demequina pelophila TaxID=1638984 RepID=UPI000784750D|nr:GtrA family protein [Demequina pelophila]
MDATAPASIAPGRLRALAARHRNFLIYAVIGGGAVVLDVGVYALLAVPAGMHPVFANTISTFVSMIFSFTSNSILNFKVTDRIVARFLSFALVTGIGYLVSTLMLAILVDGLHVHALVAKGITLPVVLILQFTLNKKTTFAPSAERTPS